MTGDHDLSQLVLSAHNRIDDGERFAITTRERADEVARKFEAIIRDRDAILGDLAERLGVIERLINGVDDDRA